MLIDSDRACGLPRSRFGNPAGDCATQAARAHAKLEIAPERDHWGLLVRMTSIGGAGKRSLFFLFSVRLRWAG